jgi:hypothetical protein
MKWPSTFTDLDGLYSVAMAKEPAEGSPALEMFPAEASPEGLSLLEQGEYQGLMEHLLAIESLEDLRCEIRGLVRVLDTNRSGDEDAEYAALCLKQVLQAQGIDRARYYLKRSHKAFGGERTNGVNDINLNRWQTYDDIETDSLWVMDRRDASGSHSAGYWGNFIPQIPRQMIKRFTRSRDWVLDPFLGSGTTLIEALRLGRNAIGVELQEDVATLAREAISNDSMARDSDSEAKILVGDCRSIDLSAELRGLGAPKASLAILHPPYHDIIQFSDRPEDLSNAGSEAEFLDWMGEVYDNTHQALQNNGHLVIVISDKYERGEWVPLGFKTMQAAESRGFRLRSIVVKNFDQTAAKRGQEALWRYRALVGGFYVFKHEYIFVMQKK